MKEEYCQMSLVQERRSWLHFVGGYYSDHQKFVKEASKHGISRRVPAQVVRGMQFGDRVIFLRYVKEASFAFAEAVITGITLDHEIAEEVGNELKAQGMAEYHEDPGGGSMVERECGSFMVCGGWSVTAPLSACIEMAIEFAEARGVKLEVMVWARLTKVYPDPVILQPAPKFNRSFTSVPDDTIMLPDEVQALDPKIFEIRNYKRNPRPARLPAKAST